MTSRMMSRTPLSYGGRGRHRTRSGDLCYSPSELGADTRGNVRHRRAVTPYRPLGGTPLIFTRIAVAAAAGAALMLVGDLAGLGPVPTESVASSHVDGPAAR
jgi:hypothetical protein